MSVLQGDVYLDKPWLSVRWDSEYECIYAEYKVFSNSSAFRMGAMTILDAIRERHAKAVVSDNRRLTGISDADKLWVPEFWVPLAAAAGMERLAVVAAYTEQDKIAIGAAVSHFGPKTFITRIFDSPDEALTWIVSSENEVE